jgi:hypothetical protein
MKKHITIAALVVVSLVTAIAGYVTALTGSGSPSGVISAEVGQIYTDTATGNIYAKTSGNGTKTGWTALKIAPLSGALSGTAVLSSGTVSITNASLATNSVLLLSAKGTATNAGTLNYTAPTTNGVTTISSVRYDGTNNVVNTADDRTVFWLSVGN